MIPEEHRRFVDDIMERYGVPPLPRRRGAAADVAAACRVAQGRPAAARRRARHDGSGSSPTPSARAPDFMVTSRPRARRPRRRRSPASGSTPSARSPPASTSSSPRATRPAATPARSRRWCSSPRSSTPSRPTPVLAAGGIATGPPDRRRDGARRPGRVVRLGVAHDRGGRDPPGREGEVPGGDVVGHRAVAGVAPASRPASCARRGPTSGTTPTTPTRCPCRCTGCSSPRPRGGSARSAATNDGARQLVELLRRPGRRADEPGQAGRARSCSTWSRSSSRPPSAWPPAWRY